MVNKLLKLYILGRINKRNNRSCVIYIVWSRENGCLALLQDRYHISRNRPLTRSLYIASKPRSKITKNCYVHYICGILFVCSVSVSVLILSREHSTGRTQYHISHSKLVSKLCYPLMMNFGFYQSNYDL